ncbi:MAG TPA: nucleotidyltransferase substrate binding protein [Flavobacterium sp.]|nr:nucleotidyltransferase substrate binding protein [Flavobacterium sp.]
MENQDIRWKQRFQNFEDAFMQFKIGIQKYGMTEENIIKEGIIQRFEFTHERAWNVMKDFLNYEGIQDIMGARSATREAFNKGLITDADEWMNMISSRNITVHTYQSSILEQEFNKITKIYFPLIEAFYLKMKSLI